MQQYWGQNLTVICYLLSLHSKKQVIIRDLVNWNDKHT